VTVLHRVRSLLGPDTIVEAQPDGPPRVAPRSSEACGLILEMAALEGWKVRIEGAGSWCPRGYGAPADLVLSTTALTRVVAVHPADLVATVEAGISWDALRQALADHGMWLATDPPGAGRTLGSAIATGTSGPLRGGFGSLRDHLLGLTIVTGDGRVLRPGGRVVKNVAGFDLTRLAAGSFGAFGVITTAHLRLRSVPRADLTLHASGERDDLLEVALRILEAGESPAALEVLSPAAAGRPAWTLALRLLGSEMAVAESRRSVSAACGRMLTELPPLEAIAFWRSLNAGAAEHPATLRLGALPVSLPETLDLLAHHLDDGWIAASVAAAAVRWSGTANAERIRSLRHAASQREFPVTVERAPWEVLETVGHFGAYREGVHRIVTSLRRVFDPKNVLTAATG
jgi:glycolate oxidase FAD binding subunit